MKGNKGRVIGAAWLLAAVLAGGVLGSTPAGSDSAPGGEIVSLNERGEFDIARTVRHSTLPAPLGTSAFAASGRALPGAIVKVDGLTGSANRVRVPEGFLTAPSLAAPPAIARGFLSGNPGLFKLTPADVTGLQVIRDYASPGMGMRHLTLQPVHAGIPVLQAEVKFDLKTTGELVSVSGSAIPDLKATVNTVSPTLTAAQALRLANRAVGVKGDALNAAVTPVSRFLTGTRRTTLFAPGGVYDRAPVMQLTYLPTAKGQTRLAWETTLWRRGEEDVYQVLVDAVSGRTLFINNYTDRAHGPVYDREAPQDGTPFTGSTPPVLDRVDKIFDGSEFFNNGDPHRDWWAGAAQTTTDDNNATTGSFRDLQNFLVATAAAGGNFTFTLSLAQAPSTYTKAAIVNEFYWNNRCHDIWYGFGFNEAAGNFQKSNFNLGGSGNDPVLATTQFGADAQPPKRNNANFSTPPDGSQPVMRMFEFDATNPFRDSDLAADVIAHEYGHGVTNRLIGNGNGLGGFQGGAMGEGWSDFQSLMVHAQQADNLGQPFPIGGYVINNFPAGIRSQPYSPNRTFFTRTFVNIGDQIPNFGPEVHLAGEIMCNALFDAYGRFVGRLGFTAGRTRAMQLFINACKLCPANPTYLDFRDALLTADANGFANADKDDIWAAFAEHGMGVNASTSGVDDVNPVEDFSTPSGNPDTPPAPANFHATLIDATHVDVSWSDVTGETGYLLEASVNAEPFFSLDNIAIPANTTLVHLVLTSGFNPGDQIAFRVRAKSANGNSPPSNVDTVTLPGGLPVPAPPSDFSVTLLTNTTAECDWTDHAGNETKFVLEASINLGPWTDIPQISIPANAESVQIQFTGFSPGDQISLRIHAENASGPSLPSNSDTIVVPGGPQAPGTPGNFGASLINKNKQVNCHWSDVSGEDGYRVELSLNGGGFTPLNPAAKANKTSLKLTLPAVHQGDQLTLRVRSFNESGSSQPSNSVVLNIPFTKPAAPKTLKAAPNAGTDGSTKITLTYVDKANNEQGFRVELQAPGQGFQEIGTVGPNVTVVQVSNLTPNTTWKFRVRAFNPAGNSAYSNVATAKTKP